MHNSSFSFYTFAEETFQDPYSIPANASPEQTATACQNTSSDYQSELIPALCGIIFITGIVGNGLVITVLCLPNGRKTVASIYIFNLVIADLLFLPTFPLWATYYAFGFNWLFGLVMCKISSSLLCVNLFASIFFITCMSIDRYLAIVHPFQSQRRTRQKACFIAFIIWGLACLFSLPTFYFRDMQYIESLGVNACIMAFPHEQYSKWCAGMALIKNLLGFFIPLTVIAYCFLGIGLHLWKSQGLWKIKQKRDKSLKMVAAVVLAFIICWLPFHVLTFLDALTWLNIVNDCNVLAIIDTVMPFVFCIGFANSCVNPLLYCFVGNQFREKFKHLFKLKLSRYIGSRQSSSSRKGRH
ncbi:type-2 angiotensin II receptor [Rhinatrema bivittatum]|uniref:type-2 angiotensin II receptor n=1 Tax=Rhinatrema bivittatum TaxID=194408 RepID=UPI00112BEF7B|nr:type-2 angiotensin II receptor [Rhinatrema bivittatum]XP_029462581.1 type-2 angiotensin II receptor [Rhinatrema bivittatum]XP_029462582.1 type-2 angiotensin II receptor [Rhinatrema bivittatum]